MSMKAIIKKYPDIDYFDSEIIAEGEIDSLEYEGEV